MKTLLITVNILLAAYLVWSAAKQFGSISTASKVEYSVKKAAPKKQLPQVKPVKTETKRERIKDPIASLIEENIFNPDRCPNANTPGGQNARVELSLVGTFRVGSCVGAIILQKSSANQSRFPGAFPGFQPGAPGAAGTTNNRRGGRRNTMNANNVQGISNPSTQTQVVYKQYVRLGETLSNGYTLAEVSPDKVTLKRGSDKLELELLEASKNAPQTATRAANQRPNPGAQMLQMMQNMQNAQFFQNMQMMRMMRGNQQQDTGGGRAGVGGNTRGAQRGR